MPITAAGSPNQPGNSQTIAHTSEVAPVPNRHRSPRPPKQRPMAQPPPDPPDDDEREAAKRKRHHLQLMPAGNGRPAGLNRLCRSDLFALEAYEAERNAFRAKMIRHKRLRRIYLGDAISLLFEDRLTVQYQIQEMLRFERIVDPEAIQRELDAYNPLIPDGENLKATMLVAFADTDTPGQVPARPHGIGQRVYAQVDERPRMFAVADEDLAGPSQSEPSGVHFLRFGFTPKAIAALREGANLRFGIDDDWLQTEVETSAHMRRALVSDFD